MTDTQWIALSFTEGRVVRDLFENRIFEELSQKNIKTILFTPAARVPGFVQKWSRTGVQFQVLSPYPLGAREQRALGIRKRMMRLGGKIFGFWISQEYKFFPLDNPYVEILKENNCQAAVITHPMFHSEMPLYRAAKELKIPTLGVLRSWDNLYKGLRLYTDFLAVWNTVNRDEASNIMLYPPDRVAMIGGTQFDPYFAPDAQWSREEFAQTIQLDPRRPILTLANLGASVVYPYDETYLVDFLLEAIRSGQIAGSPQLIIRLHPASKYEAFQKYLDLKDVRISHVTGYIPALDWTMSREDVIWVGNLLRHSDVVISPGSTITIETAIFDTPTLVPVFHTYQPESGRIQFEHHLARHFKRLVELDLVPIIQKPEELVPAINRCLKDRSWYREQRAQLVKDYICFTDGCSTKRLAELIWRISRREPIQ